MIKGIRWVKDSDADGYPDSANPTPVVSTTNGGARPDATYVRKNFVWTVEEQEFYQKKGFDNPPARCKECRALKKARFNEGRGMGGPRQSFEITCAECGKKDTVPFSPKDPGSVLCRDCYRAKRG